MSGFFMSARYMPCPECGESLDQWESAQHVCDHERLVDPQFFELRDERTAFEEQFQAYLESKQGRFGQYYAQRGRSG